MYKYKNCMYKYKNCMYKYNSCDFIIQLWRSDQLKIMRQSI